MSCCVIRVHIVYLPYRRSVQFLCQPNQGSIPTSDPTTRHSSFWKRFAVVLLKHHATWCTLTPLFRCQFNPKPILKTGRYSTTASQQLWKKYCNCFIFLRDVFSYWIYLPKMYPIIYIYIIYILIQYIKYRKWKKKNYVKYYTGLRGRLESRMARLMTWEASPSDTVRPRNKLVKKCWKKHQPEEIEVVHVSLSIHFGHLDVRWNQHGTS